jgi:photosystem II stability/assembly factor-like uncharacterized protein
MLSACLAFVFAVVPSHAQWQIETSNTTADLRGIHSVGGGVAWASGTNGTVLRTEDGGYVWQTCAIPPGAEKLDFRGIQAFDANTAIVMSSGKGDLSRLYKTTDGCHTWKLIFTNPDPGGFFDAISYSRADDGRLHGWILGDPVSNSFRVFQSTSNDGTSFKADETLTLSARPDEAGAFAASNSAFYELLKGPVLPTGLPVPPPPPGSKSKDKYEMTERPVQWFVTGGKGGARVYVRQPDWMFDFAVNEKWVSHPLAVGSHTEASGAFSIVVHSLSSGVIVGGDYSKPEDSAHTAAYRAPKAERWLASQTPPHGYRSSVAYDEKTKTWITVGPNGTDISTDDGRNWRAVHPNAALHEAPDADRNWNAISLPYVVGPKGRIGKLDEAAIKK